MTVASKQELIGKFAQQTGADVPGVPKAPAQTPAPQTDDIHINTEPTAAAPTQAGSETATESEPELFKDSFSDRTKPEPWQSSKYRTLMVILCVVPVFVGIGWFFKDGIPKPQFGTKRPISPSVATDPDSDKPKPATDGEWSSLAATNGMHQDFASAAQPNGPATPNNLKNTKPGALKTGTISTRPTTARRVAMARPSAVPMDYDSRPLTRSYTPNVSYRAPAPSYPTYRTPPIYPSRQAISMRPAATAAPATAEQQKSAQDRWMALSTGTSAQASNETGSVQSANAPTAYNQPVGASGYSTAQSPRSPYGAQNASYLPSESSVIDGQPQSLIHRSAKAKGRLVSGIAFTPGSLAALSGQPVEIEITDTLNSQIPKGARIVAVVDANTNGAGSYGIRSSAIRLVPTALAIGDMEIPLDGSAIAITGSNGKPLIAKAPGSGFFKSLGGILGTAVQGVGLANLGAGQNASFGNGTYLTAIGANVGTTLLGNATQRLQQTGSQQSVLILPEQTEIQISILKPLSLPVMGGLESAAPFSEMPGQPNVTASGFREPTDAELYSQVQQEQQGQGLQQPTQEGQVDVQ